MERCDFCNQEHNSLIEINLEGDKQSKHLCHTCFLLTIPAPSQLKKISESSLQSSTYPELNMYLYKRLYKTYDINAEQEKNTRINKKSKKDASSYLTNLTTTITSSNFYGREKEIREIFDIMARKNKKNPIILGPSGVGKTAIVNHIAYLIAKKQAPASLHNKEIYSLNLNQLMSGTKYRGDLEERFISLTNTLEEKQNPILFIDDFSSISRGSGIDDANGIGDILKPYITSNSVQILGTSTIDDYKKNIEPNKSLNRLFQPVYLDEQSVEEIIPIIQSVAPSISSYHNVSISNETIEKCVKLADQYVKYRCFPDKAIDILDIACAKKKNIISSSKCNHLDIEKIMHSAADKLNAIPNSIDIVEALIGSESARKPIINCSLYLQNSCKNLLMETAPAEININDLSEVIESWTKIPVNTMSSSYKEQLRQIAPNIKGQLIGQDEAVDTVVSAICRRRLGISKNKRPSSFIFVGETGVGKTELAKAVTLNMFGSVDKMIRFDMSEYMESHSVSKLIGAPPGYVGYTESGQLTDALRRTPFCVLLFDEIEKAHPDVSNILLQLLDDGRITDSKGELIDASHAIVILTSNAGSTLTKSIGFGKSSTESNKAIFEKGLTSAFRPEFLGRVDNIITFNHLTENDYAKIAQIHLNKIAENLNESGIDISFDENVTTYICNKANTAKYHAREIARTSIKYIEEAVASKMLESDEDNISSIKVEVTDDKLDISIKGLLTVV